MMLRWLKRWLGSGDAENGSGGGADPSMIACEEALARIYEYMDGELEPSSHEEVEAHFRVCTRCYPHLTMEESFRARVQAVLSKPEVPPTLRDRVLAILDEEGPEG